MTRRSTASTVKASTELLGHHLAFFKTLHEDESDRGARLQSLARVYVGIEAAYIGALAYKFKDVPIVAGTSGTPNIVFSIALSCMTFALCFTVAAIAIRTMEGLVDAKELANDLDAEDQSVEVFLYDRCMDYAVVTVRNSKVNDSRALRLQYAGLLILAAIFVHIGGLAVAMAG
jgi:hypothetical protein